MSDTHERFRTARQFEPELTPRQREILAMLAAGRTNNEIAATFEMTEGGAKWHVSEIYSKLGLASREEAAAYWHWRNGIGQRAAPFARALVPFTGWKLVALSTAAIATTAILVVGLLFLLLRDDASTDGIPTYTATVQFTTEGAPTGTLSIAYADQRHWSSVSRDSSNELLGYFAADGSRLLVYAKHEQSNGGPADAFGDFYAEASLAFLDDIAGQPTQVTEGGPVGRTLAPTMAATFDSLRASEGQPGSFARIAGHATHLGRKVTVIESGPAYSADGARSGVVRTYIDDGTLLVLRQETPMPRAPFIAEVVALDTSPGFTSSTFTFTLPPGTTPLGTENRPPGESRIDAPPGYLAITSLPPGFFVQYTRISLDDLGRLEVELFRPSDLDQPNMPFGGGILSLSQRPVPGPSYGPPSGTVEQIELPYTNTAVLSTTTDGKMQVTLDTPTTNVRVFNSALTREQFLAWLATLELR